MRRIDAPQGSIAWKRARIGIVTASCLSEILTPKKLEPAKGTAYLHRLVAEWMLGEPIDTEATDWRLRGNVMEAQALAWYCFERDVEVEEVGFLLRDDGRLGASPDGLVGSDGGIELKCPSATEMVGYLLDPSSLLTEYRHQVQGGMLVSERTWWDLAAWHPTMPPVLIRCAPEPEYLAKLLPALDTFNARLDAAKATLAAKREEVLVGNPLA